MKEEKILQIKQLLTQFSTERGSLKAVDGLSLDLFKGKTLGLVGESGSGKSMTALSIMRLITARGASTQGSVLLNGRNLLSLSEGEMEKVRGNKIAMIFQEPMTCLNPVFTIGDQIAEVLVLHKQMTEKKAYEKSIELLDQVGIPEPDKRIDAYPHQLSGGQRQRVMIAIALACDPEVLIADEPTTALDVTIQAQILALMVKLQRERGMAILFITHDLGVVAQVCHDVAVMYAGRIVEYTSAKNIFSRPMHPYTKGLLQSIPTFSLQKRKQLFTIKGVVPSLLDLPRGCSFQDRCNFATAQCKKPVFLQEKEKDHQVACFHPLTSDQPSKRNS